MASCYSCMSRNVKRQSAQAKFDTITKKLAKRPNNDALKAALIEARSELNFAKSQEMIHRATCKESS